MMDYGKCHKCGSESVEDTENGTIYPTEIEQEFRCLDCGATWDIIFTPIARKNHAKAGTTVRLRKNADEKATQASHRHADVVAGAGKKAVP